MNGINIVDNNIEEYFIIDLSTYTENSQLAHLSSIKFLFDETKKSNPNDLNKNDMLKFLSCKRFTGLHNRSKNLHILCIKKYLIYSGRNDLVDKLPKKYQVKNGDLDVNSLITRDDIDDILNVVGVKLRALIMVLYEGALRKGELINIKRKNVKFTGDYITLYIETSKTTKRAVYLSESVPYIKEWFDRKNFKPNDLIFRYTNSTSLNAMFNDVVERLEKRDPKKWSGRKIYPHLFRHSRLTELARTKMNEAQLRKFAGWTKNSGMAEVYFHLVDDDIKKILLGDEIETPKPKKFKPVICPTCGIENNAQRILCWKCNNLLKESDRKNVVPELISQEDKVEALTNKLNNLEELVKELVEKAFSEKEKKAEKDMDKVLGIAEKEYGMNIWDKYEIKKPKE